MVSDATKGGVVVCESFPRHQHSISIYGPWPSTDALSGINHAWLRVTTKRGLIPRRVAGNKSKSQMRTHEGNRLYVVAPILTLNF